MDEGPTSSPFDGGSVSMIDLTAEEESEDGHKKQETADGYQPYRQETELVPPFLHRVPVD